MNNVLNTLKLDFYIAKSSYSRIIVIYLISILLGLLTQPLILIYLIMFFGVSFSGLPFSITEKNNCEKLYGILPIHKSVTIAGRYLYAVVFGIVNLLISVILAIMITVLTKQQMGPFILFMSISLTFCYYCFAVGVSYPTYYKFGFSKSYIFISLPLYLIILLVVFLLERFDFTETIDQIFQYLSSHYVLALFYGFILSMVLILMSAFISYHVFRNTEL